MENTLSIAQQLVEDASLYEDTEALNNVVTVVMSKSGLPAGKAFPILRWALTGAKVVLRRQFPLRPYGDIELRVNAPLHMCDPLLC